MNDVFLTCDQVAKRWLVRTATLSQWRWNGKGPLFVKIGRRVLYRLQDIEAFEKEKIYANTTQVALARKGF